MVILATTRMLTSWASPPTSTPREWQRIVDKDELLRKWAAIIEEVYANRLNGDNTALGILVQFAQEWDFVSSNE